MRFRPTATGLLLVLSVLTIACEVDTKLRVAGGNPPDIAMSGNGTLSRLVIRGHRRLRMIEGPDSVADWYITMSNYEHDELVSTVNPITYGKISKEYV